MSLLSNYYQIIMNRSVLQDSQPQSPLQQPISESLIESLPAEFQNPLNFSNKTIKQNQSMAELGTYDCFYSNISLTNKKDVLFKQNISLRRDLRDAQEEIRTFRLKAGLWEKTLEAILSLNLGRDMTAVRHGGSDSLIQKDFFKMLRSLETNGGIGLESANPAEGQLIHRIRSAKTLKIDQKSKDIQKLQNQNDQKSRQIITLEYQLSLIKEHLSLLQNNAKSDRTIRLDKVRKLLGQKSEELHHMESANRTLEESNKKLTSEMSVLKGQIINIRKSHQNLEESIHSEKQLHEKYIGENQVLNQSMKIQGKYSEWLKSANYELQLENQQKISEIQTLKKQYSQSNKELSKMVLAMDKFRVKIDEAKHLNRSYMKKIIDPKTDQSTHCNGQNSLSLIDQQKIKSTDKELAFQSSANKIAEESEKKLQ